MAALFLRPSPVARRTSTTSFSGHPETLPSAQLRLKTPSNTGRRRPSLAATAAAAAGAPGEVEGAHASQGKSGEQRAKNDDSRSIDEIKEALYEAVDGTNRGIFGATSEKKTEITSLVELMETRNPTTHPTDNLREKVEGCWKLLYSTISILGVKRTKLGLREFISLGDFLQKIDVVEERAINIIKFNVKGLRIVSGQLTIVARYSIASKSRVDIQLESSSITPKQLMDIFEKNYDLLLGIFNPEGWLEITYPYERLDFFPICNIMEKDDAKGFYTNFVGFLCHLRYVDDSIRIGRDDKGNIFVLEKTEQMTT